MYNLNFVKLWPSLLKCPPSFLTNSTQGMPFLIHGCYQVKYCINMYIHMYIYCICMQFNLRRRTWTLFVTEGGVHAPHSTNAPARVMKDILSYSLLHGIC